MLASRQTSITPDPIMNRLASVMPADSTPEDYASFLASVSDDIKEKTRDILRSEDPVSLADRRLLSKLETIMRAADTIYGASYSFRARRH